MILALVRRIALPLARLASRLGSKPVFGVASNLQLGMMIFVAEDAFGVVYSWPKSTDQAREFAWKMINAADDLDRELGRY